MIYDKVDYEINWIFMYSPLYVFFDILRFRKVNALTIWKQCWPTEAALYCQPARMKSILVELNVIYFIQFVIFCNVGPM